MNNHTTKPEDESVSQTAYCIYINTVLDGPVPSVRNSDGCPFVFPTRDDAEREIVENALDRLQAYLDGERDFDDAITIEEYVVDVVVYPNGSVMDEDGHVFGKNT